MSSDDLLPSFDQTCGTNPVPRSRQAELDAKLAEVGGSSARNDLLRRLQEARDDRGRPMGQAELTAEALTQLIAGSDTTSK